MTYKVRRQFLTGKPILQRNFSITTPLWLDVDSMPDRFECIDAEKLDHLLGRLKTLQERVDTYDRHASIQRKARAKRKANGHESDTKLVPSHRRRLESGPETVPADADETTPPGGAS